MTPRELRDLDLELAWLLGWTIVEVAAGERWDFYRGRPPLVTWDEGRTIPLPYWSSSNAEAADLLEDAEKWGCEYHTWNNQPDSAGTCLWKACNISRGQVDVDGIGTTPACAIAQAIKAFLEEVNKAKKEPNDVDTTETTDTSPAIPQGAGGAGDGDRSGRR